MKTNIVCSLSVIAGLFLCISACKKYEEGPGFSLRTKKERVSNAWKVSFYSENGVDKTTFFNAFYSGGKFHIANTGGFIFTYKENGVIDRDLGGDWYFNNDKTGIIFMQSTPTSETWTWEILKLREREMWVREVDSAGMEMDLHFIPF